MKATLSHEVAYAAMFEFLARRNDRLGSEDISVLLGDLSITPNGTTADSASWSEWLEAIAAAESNEVDLRRRTSSGVSF